MGGVVGLVGLGVMGRNHLRTLSQVTEVTDVYVYDTEQNESALRFGRMVPSLESMVDGDILYAVVSTPSNNHKDSALELLQRGVDVFIEKPLAESARVAAELFEESKALPGRILGVGHVERFNAALMEARSLLSNSVLGDLYSVSTVRRGPMPARDLGTGVGVDLAVHDVDIIRWATSSEYVEVQAQSAGPRLNGSETFLRVIATLDSGISVEHAIDWLSPKKERSVEFLGEKGSLKVNLLTLDLELTTHDPTEIHWQSLEVLTGSQQSSTRSIPVSKQEPLLKQHEDLFDHVIRGSKTKTASVTDGIRALEIVEQILDKIR